MRFFENEDLAILNKLGVWIAEGDRPGNYYCKAELDKPVEQANKIARDLGFGYRFRKEKDK